MTIKPKASKNAVLSNAYEFVSVQGTEIKDLQDKQKTLKKWKGQGS